MQLCRAFLESRVGEQHRRQDLADRLEAPNLQPKQVAQCVPS